MLKIFWNLLLYWLIALTFKA